MFGPNWKTTLAGAAAIAAGIAHVLVSLSNGDLNAAVIDAGVIFAGIQGLFAKDHNVTGGTVSQ